MVIADVIRTSVTLTKEFINKASLFVIPAGSKRESRQSKSWMPD